MIIAIDGPSGTGKSTVAKGVAKKLGFTFFDTGAMYRSMAWWARKQSVDVGDEQAVKQLLPSFEYEIKTDATGNRKYFVAGTDVSAEIRSPEISALASKISVYADVRRTLVKIQRDFGHKQNAVFEGRDMGTVVFPDAEVKVFLTASPKIRAERRYRELIAKFPDMENGLSYEQILTDLEKRDHSDMTRAVSPLKKADGAILIDTSDLSADEVIEKVVVEAKKQHSPGKMRWFYGFVYWTVRCYLKLFYRLKIHGLSHFRAGSAIIAANHASLFDPPVVSISCPEEVHFLAKQSLFEHPLFGSLIRKLNAHPVTRSGADAATFRLILDLLSQGRKVILFPEGNRTPDGQLQPIERGLAFLVMKSKCAIQPVYVHGTFEAWPVQRKLPKLCGKMACVFGSPIGWERFEGLEKKEAERQITEQMAQALRDLKAWFEAGANGAPP